jgi:hypothetical protein
MKKLHKTSVLFSLIIIFGLVTATIPLLSPSFVTASPDAGDAWTTPLNITVVYGNAMPSWDDRAIAVDAQGNIHIAYMGESDNEVGNPEVYYLTNAGGSWIWANVSKMNRSVMQLGPVIAIDNTGVVHIAWTTMDANSIDVYYSNNAGGTWSTPVNVTGTGGAYNLELYPCMVFDTSNILHMVYVFLDNMTTSDPVYVDAWLEYVTYDGSTWSSPINLTYPFDAMYAKKSMDISPTGQIFLAYCAWNTSDTSYAEILLLNKTGTAWGTPVNLTKNMASSIQDQDPSLDIDGAGDIHLVWESQDAGDYGVNYMVYSGGSWSAPVFINATQDNVEYLSIKTDINNKAHVAFSQSYSGSGEIYYTNNTVGSFGTPVNITKTTADETNPHLILDQNGYGHIVFQNMTDVDQIYYVSSTEPLAQPAGDIMLIIIVVAVVVVVVGIGAAVFLMRRRPPK